ncbi:MAG: vitamin B12-dependent ribonucleotide reductase [Candidatus Aenigmarchaeota archaeon]|nr:vitamin B12-dependent ribonucleotide reductase [Candidatus Aenigmarchaeota archaeon]
MQTTSLITKIVKRDGRIVDFDTEKITNAIFSAAQSVGGNDRALAESLTQKVLHYLTSKYTGTNPTVEEVQDAVEKILVENGHAKTVKAYILYREEHKKIRESRQAVLEGKPTTLKVSTNSLTVLKERYLKRDPQGNIIETPEQMCRRIAHNLAQAEKLYGQDAEKTEEKFYNLLSNMEFLPNSPTIMNAGNVLQQLSACFVIPVEDSMAGIFDAVKWAALIHQTGGGTGFAFSRLRPKNDVVRSTSGVSSGPISFMKVFDSATEAIKQGGKRRGANMGILRVDHPDILDFITMKEDNKTLQNFNISVAATDRFMEALEKNEEYELINPRHGEVIKKISARHVWDLIILEAWKTGDPGVVFIDRINNSRANPTPFLGQIESTNPCGEQPLLPFEACNLGSVNLAKFHKDGDVNWEGLKECVHESIQFLDNVIDMNRYPLPQIEHICKTNRRIGLGLMGFADLLFHLKIRYDSEDGVNCGRKIMQFISAEADKASMELAKIRGAFPNFDKSIYAGGTHLRNCTRTTIAPTGTISMIADCSSGIEPLFALVFHKVVMDGKELLYANDVFEKTARERGFYTEELMRRIANKGSIQDIPEIPQDVKEVFRVSYDISPYWHVRMQSAFQEFTDNAVSKTVNFPNFATTKDVEEVYLLAYKLGCKGVTVYRDGSKSVQVLNVNFDEKKQKQQKQEIKEATKEDSCPECKTKMHFQEGCAMCPNCGYSMCSVG